MARSTAAPLGRPTRGTTISDYQAKRDFNTTSEPPAGTTRRPGKPGAPIFVVQKHRAKRAGLHWDFRLEHNGVLWSWAVRKGPSMDPADKRLAAHVEDHPLDYADFQGAIPDGQYGAGEVETWDRGTWTPVTDPDEGMRDGEIKFHLAGSRLNGGFVLVRLRPKPNQRGHQDNWLLIKERDGSVRAGADAEVLEAASAAPKPRPKRARAADGPPAPAAVRRSLPDRQAPQLATVADRPPTGDGWVTEIKFDGYRIIASVNDGVVTLMTRNGHNWTDRLPAVAAAMRALDVTSVRVDGELVALGKDGVSSFSALQGALSAGRDHTLFFCLFDLLYLDGWDLRPCSLRDRKHVLHGLDAWKGMLRYSDHQDGGAQQMLDAARRLKLEGIICKQADAPYKPGRGRSWLKVKTLDREEFIVIGWTAPAGSRVGLGSLHLGYYDPGGDLHYAGGVGTGFSDDVLQQLHDALEELPDDPPKSLLVAGNDLEKTIRWVEPSLVVETSFTGWSGAGRLRHAVYLGLREDKTAREVVRPIANPDAERCRVDPMRAGGSAGRRTPVIAIPPKRQAAHSVAARSSSAIVTARAPKARSETIEGITLTHPDRALWPGISKRDLAHYWQAVADHALPGLARRPLAVVRCPDGIGGEHFFQKHGHGMMPDGVRDGVADKAPFLAIDGLRGLIAMAQMSAIELHVWGATEADPLHPDQLVFDLDPGEGVAFPAVVAAALDLRKALEALDLAAFCRTSGGKGLHLVVPLRPEHGWDEARNFSRRFAEDMSKRRPDLYLSTVKKADRRGRILIDWLRNGLGSTAVASFCPRARPGAGVATPLSWQEVTPALDPAAWTVTSMPGRLAELKDDPWAGFDGSRRQLPATLEPEASAAPPAQPKGKSRIVTAKPARPRQRSGAGRS